MIMAKAALSALAIASIVSPLDPTTMAHIALGEVGGPGIWGTPERAWELQAMVVWVARNQEARAPADYDPRWQFYGWEDVVTERDIERAAAVISSQGADPTGGALHVLSETDRIKLGFPRGDIVECGVAPFCLHFFHAWPSIQPQAKGSGGLSEH